MSIKFFVLHVFLVFSIIAQDIPSTAPAASTGSTTLIPPTGEKTLAEGELKKVLAEVEASRKILDTISRTLNAVPDSLRKLDSAATRSQETLQTISSLSENIKKIENLVEHVPQKVAEVEASSSKKQGDYQTSLTSQLSALQTLVSNQQKSFEELRSTLATISEHTKGLEQLTKAQKGNAKQTELLEKILSNHDVIFKNHQKIISKLDKTLGETFQGYYEKLRNGTQDASQFFSDAISGKKGTAGANLKKSASTLLTQAGGFATKASGQGQALVIKYHGELSQHLKQFGVPDPYNVYAATAILTIPLSLLALLIVSMTFQIVRILVSIIFYPCYCCFRRRSRPSEDGESKKRKSSEVERDSMASSKPPGKKQNTNTTRK